MVIGIDMGTTSFAGVLVNGDGEVLKTVTRPNDCTLTGLPPGVHEQDADAMADAAGALVAELEDAAGGPVRRIGWTGQMHGVVGVDENLKAVTPFVTWRDARRYGGRVMAGWARAGRKLFRCLPLPGYAIARRTGRCVIDETFLHSWHLEETRDVPRQWLPDLVPGSMLGDNQAGVFAAQHFLPGYAVANLGTSGQLSVVGEGRGGERRPYPGGRVLRCRASLVGGRAFSELKKDLGLSWDEMNARAESDARIAACAWNIANDLADDLDLTGVTGLVGIGNALARNPCLKAAVEKRFKMTCVVPPVAEMAAWGAALEVMA